MGGPEDVADPEDECGKVGVREGDAADGVSVGHPWAQTSGKGPHCGAVASGPGAQDIPVWGLAAQVACNATLSWAELHENPPRGVNSHMCDPAFKESDGVSFENPILLNASKGAVVVKSII